MPEEAMEEITLGVNNMALGEELYENRTMSKEYIEPRAEILRQHEIVINFFSIGCMIKVGCKSIPFSTTEEAMKELNEYVANPRNATKKWNRIFEEYK